MAIMSTVATSTTRMRAVATRKMYRAENDPGLDVEDQHPTTATMTMAIPLRISASEVSAHPPADAFWDPSTMMKIPKMLVSALDAKSTFASPIMVLFSLFGGLFWFDLRSAKARDGSAMCSCR